MPSVTFRCPRCEQTVTAPIAPAMTQLQCAQCHATAEVPDGAFQLLSDEPSPGPSLSGRGDESNVQLHRCLVCPSRDLFLRKDFPQRLGIAIVVIGFSGFLTAQYFHLIYLAFAFLFATALIDVALYFLVGDALVCYRCGAHYRGFSDLGDHTGFELETHERYRQLAARMAETAVGENRKAVEPGHHTH